jgi:hypothetical protein
MPATVEKSRKTIESTLRKFGGKKFLAGWDEDASSWTVMFQLGQHQVRFDLDMPERREAKYTPTGRTRNPNRTESVLEDLEKQKWQALADLIKAKLQGIEAGVTTFEKEFMAYLVWPSGETVYQQMEPAIIHPVENDSLRKRLEQAIQGIQSHPPDGKPALGPPTGALPEEIDY